jgi:hypothetical protein
MSTPINKDGASDEQHDPAGHPSQARATNVLDHDRLRILRRIQQLRDPTTPRTRSSIATSCCG